MGSIYRYSIKSDIGLQAYDAAKTLLKPRAIEDVILGFGTPSDNADAVEGVFSFSGERFIIRCERISNLPKDADSTSFKEAAALITNDGLASWLVSKGFDHKVEHAAGDQQPHTSEDWVLESTNGDGTSYLVNQDTQTVGLWRICTGSPGAGEWQDLATNLRPDQAYALLTVTL
ncbi:hypothetical protein [Sphingosinicella sp. BN140058]|uniref:hypothetical protein n=1 Tax=Sphingosinicella sp. BN140058 TaxID=1892855 RepID=UPI0010112B2A|nr:hypothetical protein [Sphingosinicella sp. BN140058]QAY80231.1 hypothetical protein ETR14_26675 [Sphingosinicella sp. BN140058]